MDASTRKNKDTIDIICLWCHAVWQNRNRRASSTLSPILYLFLAPSGKLYQKIQHLPAEDEKAEGSKAPVIKHRRPGPRNLAYGISPEQWPTVVHRVIEKKEPLRKVADDYGVSHETIRRLIRSSQKKRAS